MQTAAWFSYCCHKLRLFKLVEQNTGGCSPVNWLSQTRRNVTIEFLDLNFWSRRKLSKNSVFYENMNTAAFFRRNNKIWRKDLLCKSSTVASNQVTCQTSDITKEFRETAIQFHGTFHGLKITNWLPSLSDIDILRDSVPDLKI